MQSIDRAMTVAHILIENEGSLSITSLSKKCELPLSTLHRLLKAMIKQGMVQQDEQTKLYSPGAVWLEYGLKVYDTMDYISLIRPELERLMREVDESVYLSKPLETEAIIIERIDSQKNPIRIYDQLGIRIPMHIGAANKAMLAGMSTAQSKEILMQLLPVEKIPELQKILTQIKENGFAISHGEKTEGTSAIAVPIVDRFGNVFAALSIGMVTFNLTEERINYLSKKTVEAGNRISGILGSQYNTIR